MLVPVEVEVHTVPHFKAPVNAKVHRGIKYPYPPTFYRAAPSSIMKPHSNESFNGKFQLKIGVKLVADRRIC